MKTMKTMTTQVQHSEFYYLKQLLAALPRLSQETGYSLIALAWAYFTGRIAFRMEFEEFCAYRLYEYSFKKRSEFLLNHRSIKISNKLTANATEDDLIIFDDKRRFNEVFREFVHRDWLFLPDASAQDIRAFLGRNSAFLVKDYLGKQGRDILKFDASDLDVDAFIRDYQGKPYLLESFILQHPAMAEPNPSTVNTVRIQTVLKDGKLLLLGGCIRCGGSGAHVDNFHQGGVAYPLDMEIGAITGPGSNVSGKRYSCHPSTGLFMPGFHIPHWDLVLQSVRKAAMIVPAAGYVGWDVAVTPDGVEFVEANVNYPDPTILQLDGVGRYQLLKDFIAQ